MTIDQIRAMHASRSLRWTNYIAVRLLQRGIKTADIESALLTSEIIEQYPSDYPYPSCLVLGTGCAGTPIHVVCGASETELWLVPALMPNDAEWNAGYRTRKRADV